MKMMQGADAAASWNSCLNFASDSPASRLVPQRCHCQL